MSQTIQQRLKQLLARHTQAEIARKAGVPATSVYRYLRGAKVPSEFCAALVREFGVNPGWLITGEGVPYLADISAETGRTAGSLLDVVAAMNQIVRMRLGALAGKGHLKSIRELRQAVEDYETLRLRLSRQVKPLFEELLTKYRHAINRSLLYGHDPARAGPARETLAQLGRLIDDPLLLGSYHAYTAHEAFLRRDFEGAVRGTRFAFRMSLTTEEFSSQSARDAVNLAAAMGAAGRFAECRAMARAARCLLEDHPEMRDEYHAARLVAAVSDIELGNLGANAGEILDAYASLSPVQQQVYSGRLVHVLLLTGAASLEGSLGLGAPGRRRDLRLLAFATWQEAAPELGFAMKHVVSGDAMGVPADSSEAACARALHEALLGRSAAARRLCSETSGETSALSRFRWTLSRAQLARVAGLGESRELAAECDKLLAALQRGVSPELLELGIHWRNVLADPRQNHDRANSFFQRMEQSGFRCFAARRQAAGSP